MISQIPNDRMSFEYTMESSLPTCLFVVLISVRDVKKSKAGCVRIKSHVLCFIIENQRIYIGCPDKQSPWTFPMNGEHPIIYAWENTDIHDVIESDVMIYI